MPIVEGRFHATESTGQGMGTTVSNPQTTFRSGSILGIYASHSSKLLKPHAQQAGRDTTPREKVKQPG